MNMTDSEMRIELIAKMQKLHETLGRIPDRYDWVIYSSSRWQDYFKSWAEFLKEAGVVKAGANHVQPPSPDAEKLCEVLRTIEKRLGRKTCEIDWVKALSEYRYHKQWKKHFTICCVDTYNGKLKGRPYSRESKKVEHIRRAYTENMKYFFEDDGAWLSFRYAARVDKYTPDDLILLGIRNLKSIMEQSGTMFRYYMDEFEIPSSETIRGLTANEMFNNDVIRLLFGRDLPHFAIIEHFGTFRCYFEAVYDQWKSNEQKSSEQNSSDLHHGTNNNESIEDLLFSLKGIVRKLSEKGVNIELRLIP